jgi:chaperonin GroEL
MSNVVMGEQAQAALLEAINLVADAVEGTLGPQARTVLVTHPERPPAVLNDGVKIVSSVKSEKPAVQAAVQLFRQAALEAQQASGDGTTTATLLARAICNAYTDHPNKVQAAQEIAELTDETVAYIERQSEEIDFDALTDEGEWDELEQRLKFVATVAANNDEPLGELVAEIFTELGPDALVNLKVGSLDHTIWSHAIGTSIPTTFVSPMFCNTDKRTVEYHNPLFILTQTVIEDFEDLMPALEIAVENNRPLIIVCQDIKGVALSNLIANHVGGVVKACAIKVPYADPLAWIDDIQALVGGKNFFDAKGHTIADVVAGSKMIGSADTIRITETETVIIAGEVGKDLLPHHVLNLQKRAAASVHSFTKEKLLTRAARLNSKIANIHIGGFSEAEIRETRERVDDAVNATRLAMKGGTVLGAGVTLARLTTVTTAPATRTRNERWEKVLLEPVRVLTKNAGSEQSLADIRKLFVQKHYYSNLHKAKFHIETQDNCNVYDATLVLVNSIKAAASIARLMLLTDRIVLVGEQ